MRKNNKNQKGKVVGAVAGLIGVTVVGLLFQPKKGKKRREVLKKQTTNVNNIIKEKSSETKGMINTFLEERKHKKRNIEIALKKDREAMIFEDFNI